MNHNNHPLSSHRNQGSKKPWRSLVLAGLMTLGAITLPQAAQAMETSQNVQDHDAVWQLRRQCRLEKDVGTYIEALNDVSPQDTNSTACEKEISEAFNDFACLFQNIDTFQLFTKLVFASKMAENLTEWDVLNSTANGEGGTKIMVAKMKGIKNSGLIEHNASMTNIFDCFINKDGEGYIQSMIDWANQSPAKSVERSIKLRSVILHMMSLERISVIKGYDLLDAYYDKVIQHITFDDLESLFDSMTQYTNFLLYAVQKEKIAEYMERMKDDFWVQLNLSRATPDSNMSPEDLLRIKNAKINYNIFLQLAPIAIKGGKIIKECDYFDKECVDTNAETKPFTQQKPIMSTEEETAQIIAMLHDFMDKSAIQED